MTYLFKWLTHSSGQHRSWVCFLDLCIQLATQRLSWICLYSNISKIEFRTQHSQKNKRKTKQKSVSASPMSLKGQYYPKKVAYTRHRELIPALTLLTSTLPPPSPPQTTIISHWDYYKSNLTDVLFPIASPDGTLVIFQNDHISLLLKNLQWLPKMFSKSNCLTGLWKPWKLSHMDMKAEIWYDVCS